MQRVADSNSLMSQLRTRTHQLHERAESVIGLPQSMRQHQKILTRFFGFIQPWEASVRARRIEEERLRGREKTPLLEADLRWLGVQLEEVPICPHVPALTDLASVLGSMYVFEGATLGGQILSRHVEQKLHLSEGKGYSFYQSYGSKVGPMWREFGGLLTQLIEAEHFERAILSAEQTFGQLCDWFEKMDR